MLVNKGAAAERGAAGGAWWEPPWGGSSPGQPAPHAAVAPAPTHTHRARSVSGAGRLGGRAGVHLFEYALSKFEALLAGLGQISTPPACRRRIRHVGLGIFVKMILLCLFGKILRPP